MHRKTFTGLFVLIALGSAACTGGRPPVAPAPAPVAVEAPPPPADTVQPMGEGFELQGRRPAGIGADLLGTAEYDLPVVANEWVRMELEFLVNQRHAVVAGWMRSADRYDEWVRDVFASYGIPRDLHHLGMVESGYRPTVRSHAGAVGMWQFMPATGRGMGLRIDSLVDERMDPVRATHAAARHLRQLNREFRGDWALAAAAYNAGSGRINRGLARFNANNFWDLAQRGDLAQETRHYVPRLFAVAIIAKDPTRFGYPAPAGPAQRFAYDSIRVDLATPLPVLAQAGNLPVQQLVDLNPHMLRQVAPANYWVWVPAGQGSPLQQAYAASEFRRRGGYAYYRVREGDSLQRLADLAGVPADRIRSLNLSSNVDALRPGERLRLFADAARVLNARPVERVARRETPARSEESRSSERSASRGESTERSGARAEGRSSESRSSERSAASERESSTSAAGSSSSRSGSSSSRSGNSTASASGSSSSRTSSAASSSSGSSSRERSASAERSERSSSSGSSAGRGESESRTGSAASRTERSSSSESRSERAASTGSSRSGSSSSGGSAARTHTVEDGESLWGIARKYDVTVDAVRAANDMESETIRPGQTLRIPRAASSATASASRSESGSRSASSSTRATEGERRSSSSAASSTERRSSSSSANSTERSSTRSANSTGRNSTGSANSTERRSSSTSATSTERGTSTAGGGSGERRAASSAGSTERRATPSGSPERRSGSGERAATASGSRASTESPRHHTVADGETLWGIARRYNTSVDTLRRANNLAVDAQIKPGQRLAIPAD